MSIEIDSQITIDGRPPAEFARRLRKYPGAAGKALKGAVEFVLTDLQGRAIRAASRLTGDLKRNIGNRGAKGIFKIRVAKRSRRVVVTGEIGSTLPYARIQDKGGTITPKKSQWLTIPLDAAKTAAGVPRGNARSFTDAFFLTSAKGNLLLVERRGDGIVPLFVLKKRVRIPGTQYFTRAGEAAFKGAAKVVAARLRDALREVLG